MRLLGLDLETTGLETDSSYITEIGWVLIDTKIDKPLMTEGHLMKLPDGVEVPELITEITGITKEMLDEFGTNPVATLQRLCMVIENYAVDYIVAHNGNAFDKPMLMANMEREGLGSHFPDVKWIDTYEDVPFPKHFKYRNLTYLCGEHGFVNPFPHAALFDTMAMMRILKSYDMDEVVDRMNTPWVVVRAMVSFEDKDKAKEKGFRWQQIGDKTYPKCWVMKVKEDEVMALEEVCDFEVKRIG